MEKEALYTLVKKYRDGTISDQELNSLKAYVSSPGNDDMLLQEVFEQLADRDPLAPPVVPDPTLLFEKIVQDVHNPTPLLTRIKSSVYLKIAAAAILFLSLGSIFFQNRLASPEKQGEQMTQSSSSKPILPGQHKAQILLEDGREIDLGALANDTVIELDGYRLIKDSKGALSYAFSEKRQLHRSVYNTLVVPKGGEYQLNLPDGTQVWLNAFSKLTYPIHFGQRERRVYLEGEAYFSVTKKKVGQHQLPFIVASGNQEVEVLGTQFNINSYADKITTTLIEGSVRLHLDGKQGKQLVPNQQAIFDQHSRKVSVRYVDPYYTVAWKQGSFAFDQASLREVTDCLERWYDVSFDYRIDKDLPRFTGTISRYENIDQLLRLIEMTGAARFVIKERRIIVNE